MSIYILNIYVNIYPSKVFIAYAVFLKKRLSFRHKLQSILSNFGQKWLSQSVSANFELDL